MMLRAARPISRTPKLAEKRAKKPAFLGKNQLLTELPISRRFRVLWGRESNLPWAGHHCTGNRFHRHLFSFCRCDSVVKFFRFLVDGPGSVMPLPSSIPRLLAPPPRDLPKPRSDPGSLCRLEWTCRRLADEPAFLISRLPSQATAPAVSDR